MNNFTFNLTDKVYLWSDTHLNHMRICRMRYGNDLEGYNKIILDCINKYVGTKDILFLLGDVWWNNPGHFRNRINCRQVHHIIGNHDKQNYKNFFSTLSDTGMIKIKTGGKDRLFCFLSHFAHAYWPKSHIGAFHFYGHTHGMREKTLDEKFPERRSIDVGYETSFEFYGMPRPWLLSDLIKKLEKRKGHDPIEFYITNYPEGRDENYNTQKTYNK